jgi:acylphosphatase
MERLQALVTGRVQLVMYRDFACRNARALGLTGTVRNLPDGSVQLIVEGSRENLDLFALKLWKGSLLSKVEMVTTSFTNATGEFKTFRIIY